MKLKMILMLALLMACQTNEQKKGSVNADKPDKTPFYWENANVYFLLTDRFHNGNPENDFSYGRKKNGAVLRSFEGGDIAGITEKIESGYFEKMGIDAIWFSPPFEQIHHFTDEGTGNTYAYHGYWPKDWTTTDNNFGTMAELKNMVNKAHEKGIRVILDVIINHTGPVTENDPQYPDSWVRTGPPCTYQDFETTVSCTLVENLPDIRTESNEAVALPKLLLEKWEKEGRKEKELEELDAFFDRTGYPRAPRFYIIKWLVDFVRELGIDAFRVDTAKHTEPYVWGELYREAVIAFEAWKKENPDKVIDDTPFFMVGEVYNYSIGHGLEFPMGGDSTVNFYDEGFKSLINFSFKSDASRNPEEVFSSYSKMLHMGELQNLSVMNYISSHDDGGPFDPDRENALHGGTMLLLAPGAVQIYYGDETARKLVVEGANGDANLRSNMNWYDLENDTDLGKYTTKQVFDHYCKLGQFRKYHPAVGAGQHKMINQKPYIFARTFTDDDYTDKVIVVMEETQEATDVSDYFADGQILTNYYTGESVEVGNGKVKFEQTSPLQLIGL
ncbi:MAG TPA: alpha-amlyase [Cytophagales bacterium]|jgi:alpha-amylase|nr:alpha-amlyase [Cytophagales bacterium]